MKQRFINHIESIQDPALRNCCAEILIIPAFFTHPAAIKFHHAYEGGLLAHTVEVCDIALDSYCSMKKHESRDLSLHLQWIEIPPSDILLAAALWHDFAKIHEYAAEDVPCEWVGGEVVTVNRQWHSTSYRDTIGHISGSSAEFILAADKHGVDRRVMGAVTHAILAHHGRREWGSPVEPQTLEAMILHHADMLSSHYGAMADR